MKKSINTNAKRLTLLLFLSYVNFLFGQSPAHTVFAPADTLIGGELIEESKKYLDEKKFGDAISKAEEARGLFEKSLGESSKRVGDCLFQLGKIYLGQSDYDKAALNLEKSLEIYLKSTGEKSSEVARVYHNFGVLHHSKGEYKEAIQFFEKSKSVFLETLGENALEVANSYEKIGIISGLLSDFTLANQSFEKAIQIKSQLLGSDNLEVGKSLMIYGTSKKNEGEYKTAIQYYKKAEIIFSNPLKGDSSYLSQVYQNLGVATMGRNQEEAIFYFEKALVLKIKQLGFNNLEVARTLNGIGVVFAYKEDFEKARNYFHESLEINRNILGESHPSVAMAYSNLGIVNTELGNYEIADELFKKALEFYLKRFGESSFYVGMVYEGLGKNFYADGQIENAISYLEKAINTYIETVGEVHPYLARCCYNLGIIHEKLGDHEKSIFYFSKGLSAVNYSEDDFQPDLNSPSVLLSGLVNSGQSYQSRFQKEKDLTYLYKSKKKLNQAFMVLESQIRTQEFPFQSGLVKRARAISGVAIPTFISFFQTTDSLFYLKNALECSEKVKSFYIHQSLENSNPIKFANVPDTLIEHEIRLKEEIAKLTNQHQGLSNKKNQESDSTLQLINNDLISLNGNYDTLINYFRGHYPQYFQAKFNHQMPEIENIQQKLLTPHKTILEYFVGDSSIYIFVINKDALIMEEVAHDFPLEDWVNELREGLCSYYLSNNKTDSLFEQARIQYVSKSQAIYDKLIRPVEHLIKESVVIVPDGILACVPFEVLLKAAPQDPGNFSTYPYFIYDHAVSYCYSITQLMEIVEYAPLSHPKRAWGGFAPFSNRSFEIRGKQQADMLMIDSFYKELNIQVPASRDYVLDELPSTEEEMIAGRKIWNGVSFLGEYATEKNFLEMAGQYRILHLSTYGFSDRGRDGFSFLAFAEVADSIENELVFIRDLYSLKLDADLVVLSVCETGIEESKEGEGIVGITKALTFSGVKSIVAGLWKVGDISTSELFKKFYHQLKRGNTKEKAIQNAKLKYLKKIKGEKAHPFYWAGFIGIGDMREILFD